jgi:hypothetical protein
MTTLTKRTPRLSVRKPGYWRNRYFSLVGGWTREDGTTDEEADCLAPMRLVSREVAEEYAARNMREYERDNPGEVLYLGPVFFPEEDGSK